MLYPTLLISMPGGAEWLLIMLVIGLPIYFVPTIIGFARKHPQAIWIMVLNLLLGWTFLGWIGAFVWSLIDPKQQSSQ